MDNYNLDEHNDRERIRRDMMALADGAKLEFRISWEQDEHCHSCGNLIDTREHSAILTAERTGHGVRITGYSTENDDDGGGAFEGFEMNLTTSHIAWGWSSSCSFADKLREELDEMFS